MSPGPLGVGGGPFDMDLPLTEMEALELLEILGHDLDDRPADAGRRDVERLRDRVLAVYRGVDPG